jgi:hypothetical protein
MTSTGPAVLTRDTRERSEMKRFIGDVLDAWIEVDYDGAIPDRSEDTATHKLLIQRMRAKGGWAFRAWSDAELREIIHQYL